jgi:hypothetical protein
MRFVVSPVPNCEGPGAPTAEFYKIIACLQEQEKVRPQVWRRVILDLFGSGIWSAAIDFCS